MRRTAINGKESSKGPSSKGRNEDEWGRRTRSVVQVEAGIKRGKLLNDKAYKNLRRRSCGGEVLLLVGKGSSETRLRQGENAAQKLLQGERRNARSKARGKRAAKKAGLLVTGERWSDRKGTGNAHRKNRGD